MNAEPRHRLDAFYASVERCILTRQDAVTGLLPASTAVTAHGDYTDAWVRDNVYTILAAWGLARALERAGIADGRAYLLRQAVVKCMRGLLVAMMKQADKVERFKHTLDPIDALHAKYGSRTGEPVVADDGWGHLQIDATSLFLLMLAQMTAGGLRLVYTLDEVDFVQNLVHYIARAYRTPDYGIWERGDKLNNGYPELNSSSVGMAKAALEALRGFDLFGAEGGPGSLIHIPADDIARMRNLLESVLPRESPSKEVDAALLSVIGYPGYAVEDATLVAHTRDHIVAKLQGRYGCKRFLRDGHQTVVEDATRPHYEQGELGQFNGIESEWPLFFTYLLLDGLLTGDPARAADYRARLAGLTVERDGERLLPELYYVPEDAIDAERTAPGSQTRVANANVPLLWAQSLYLLGQLLDEGWLAAGDIDPLARRTRIGHRPGCRLLVALLAENAEVQAQLHAEGVPAQTAQQIAPIEVRYPSELTAALASVGRNAKLGLSGRPPRRAGSLVTCQVFSMAGATVVFLPQFTEVQDFYRHLDNRLLVAGCKAEFAHVRRHWDQPGQPLFTLRITAAMLAAEGAQELLDFLRGLCDDGGEFGVRVRPLAELLAVAGRKRFDRLREFRFERPPLAARPAPGSILPLDPAVTCPLDAAALQTLEAATDADLVTRLAASHNLHEQVAVLEALVRRHGLEHALPGGESLGSLLEAAYAHAADIGSWGLLRRCAGLLDKFDPKLEDAVAELVGHGKQIAVGRGYSQEAVLTGALDNAEILARIRRYGGDDPVGRVLIQELVLLLATVIKTEPALLANALTLRAWQLLLLVVGDAAWAQGLPQAEAYRLVHDLSPSTLLDWLLRVLREEHDPLARLGSLEHLHRDDAVATLAVPTFAPAFEPAPADTVDWLAWRERHGVLLRLPARFYAQVWDVLAHCTGLVIGDRFVMTNRLDSVHLRADMTAAEPNFALTVDRLLHAISAPEYRHLCVEAVSTLAGIVGANPALHVRDDIVLDVLIGHGVRLAWKTAHPAGMDYDAHRAEAWWALYASPPGAVSEALVAAFAYLLGEGRPTPA